MCDPTSKLCIYIKSDEFCKNYNLWCMKQITVFTKVNCIEKKTKSIVRTLTQVGWLSKPRYKK